MDWSACGAIAGQFKNQLRDFWVLIFIVLPHQFIYLFLYLLALHRHCISPGLTGAQEISLHHAGPRVINSHTEISDPALSYYRWSVSGNRHRPCVELFMDHVIEPLTKVFLNGSFIPALTAYEYQGYIIMTWARPESNDYTSVGIVCKRDEFGSIIQVQRIEGELFETKEQAEQHGVGLCKGWIDKQVPEFNRRVG